MIVYSCVKYLYYAAPEHKFPSGTEDCLEATQWIYDNSNKLNFIRERIAIVGDSAGGR